MTAEDLVAQTLDTAITLDAPPAAGWYFAYVIGVFRNLRRDTRKFAESPIDDVRDRGPDQLGEVIVMDQLERIRHAVTELEFELMQLAQEYRLPSTQESHGGADWARIGAMVGLSPSAAEKRERRARTKVRNLFHFGETPNDTVGDKDDEE